MTYEEAIEILEELGGCCSSDKEYKATHIAIDAIQKQIPKKPKKPSLEKDKEYRRLFRYSCPSCGSILFVKFYNEKEHHCKCGQALDWNE